MKDTRRQTVQTEGEQFGLDHIGIVVQDLQATAKILEESLNWKLDRIENYRDLLSIGFFYFGDVKVELIQPLTDEGMNADFLREQGEGVHHLAFAVSNLQEALEKAQSQGIELLLGPTTGAEGKPIAFLAGEQLGGTALELIEHSQEDAGK